MLKYRTVVKKIGPSALEFLKKDMIIFFNEDAPQELKEISIIHKPEGVFFEIEPGDVISIGNQMYKVTAVGDEANKTLKELGHFTMKFNGLVQAELPGIIHVEPGDKPVIAEDVEIKVTSGE